MGHINVILLAKLGFGLSFSLLSLTNFLSLKKNNNIKELQDKINYLEKKLEEELINEKEINKEKNIYHSYEENLNKDIFIKDENKNLKRVRKKR